MVEIYGSCRACDAMVVAPTAYQSRADAAALVHAQTTGHPVEMLSDSDPDEVLYVVAGEPSLLTEL